MAAQTIAAQVAELVGTFTVNSLDDWCGDAVNKMISVLPYEAISGFATSESCTYTGVYTELTVKNKRILEVSRAPATGSVLNRKCRLITPAQYDGEQADSNSFYYPTDYDPTYTLYADVIKVLPTVGGMVVTARRIVFVNTFDTTQTAISTLPYECLNLVVLDLSIRVALNKLASFALTSSLVTSAVPPGAPTLTTVSYTNAVIGPIGVSTIGTIPSIPVYPTIVPPGGITAASTAFDTAMVNEDTELAQTQLVKLQSFNSEHSNLIQENLGQFQKDIKKYEADLQKVLQQAELVEKELQTVYQTIADINKTNAAQTMLSILENDKILIEKYQADVAMYVQRVQADVGVYSANLQRSSVERDRYLALISMLRERYHEGLLMKFGVNLKGALDGKQN